MGAALDQWNNRKKQSQPTTAGRSGSALEVWNNGRPERMQQSINRLDAGMQSLQKQTAARKSYWDGNDQQIRQQVESMNKLMDQIESTSKRYGMTDAYNADAMKALRQYNTDVLSVLDAEAEVYGQFKSKTEYDRYVKNYAAQQKRQAAINAENERIGKMSLEELDREIERVQNRQKSFQQENGGFFGEALRTVGRGAVAITTASKGPAKGPEHDPLKETLDNYDRQDKVYSEKINTLKQARYTKLLEPLSAEALSAVDAIIKSRAMQEEQAKANRQISNETGSSSMAVYDHGTMDLETNAITKLEKMGYNNYEELVDARSRIKNAVDYEEAQKEIKREMKEENPVFMPVLANIASVGTQIGRGKSAVTDTLTTMLGRDIDIYDENHYAGMFTDTVRGTTQEMIEDQYDSKAAKFAARTAYNVGMSVADNLARMAIGYSAGGIVSPSTVAGVLMGSQVMSQAIVEGKQKGYSDEKAVGMAMVQAAIEAATEKWSVETILGDSKSVFKQVAKSFIAEGTEEVTSNVANYLADAMANGDENELRKAYDAYRQQGMSDADALTAVIWDVVGENAESFLVGGLSGAVLGSGSAAIYGSQRTALGQRIIDANQTEAFIKDAEGQHDKELYKYLNKVKGKENPSASAVGNLALRLNELGVDTDKIVEKYKDSKRQTPAEHEATTTEPAVQTESERQGISPQVRSEQENDAGRRALMDHAKEYKNTGAEQSFVDNYRTGQNVDVYAAGYNWVYQAGVDGYRFDKVEAMANGEWLNDFTREQAIEAHRAGYMEGMAVVAEPFDEVQLENNEKDAIRVADLRPGVTLVNVRDRPMNAIVRSQLAVLQSTGKELGVTFAVVDDYTKYYLNKNGGFLTKTNKIIVNLDAEGAEIEIDGKKEYLPDLLRTAGHESFHFLEEKAPESAEKMRKFVVDHYVKEGKYEALAQQYAAQGYDGMDIDSELTADNLFDVMTQEGFLKKVARQDAGAVRSIRNTLSTFIRHMNKVLSRLTMTNPIHREIYNSLNSDKRFAEKLRRMFTDALESAKNENNKPAAKRAQAKGKTETKESRKPSRYDYSKSFSEQIDDFKAGKYPKYEQMLVCRTPDIWQKIGLNALPVTINQKSVKRALFGTRDADHFIGETILRELPHLLADPVAIIRSQAEATPESLVVIIAKNVNGHQVIAAVTVDGEAQYQKERINSNAIHSIYGKEDALKQLKAAIETDSTEKNELYYWNKKEAFNLMRGEGLQLPNGSQKSGFIHSIDENGSIVKKKLNSVTDSLQFKRWFGNSEVKNANGTPKVVYHQTAADFSVFNNGNPVAGARDSETPNGYFFKDNDHDIGLDGKRQMACFIRMEKPLRFKNRQEAKSWYKTHVQGYKELSDRMDAAVGAIDDEMNALERKMFAQDVSDDRYEELEAEWDELHEKMAKVEDGYREQLRELLNGYFLHGCKYDGIILDYDGHRYVGEDRHRENVKTYIVFDNKQIKSATDNIGTFDRNNPDIKWSFAGSRSQTADHSMLEKARQMEKDGKDSETIRKKTGWFKGYDGKWRYEIDNSKSEFKATGFFTNPAVRRYNELLNEVYFQSTEDESKTQRKLEELQALKKQIDAQGVKKNPRVVGDVLKNKELYDAYPWVQNIPIRFTQMEEDERGAYSQSRQEIVLNSMKRPDVQKRTLLHEIQHLIQDAEGFAKGANLIMYNSTGTETAKGQYLRTAGEIEARDVETRMEYSEEQRKEVRPDIDRTDAIVRLSKKPVSNISEENRRLIEENEKYKALIGKLNGQIRALQKKVVDPKGVRKLAHDVRAEYQSKIPQAELEQKLTDLFDYIANEQDIDFGSITRAAAEIAKDVIGQSTALNTELTDQYKDMRDRLKTSKIRLTSLQKSEMAVQFDSYENFRRKNFGKIRFTKDGVMLDELWEDLSQAWPEFFKADEHEAEMPLRLMEAIEATNPFHENPYGMNMDEAAYDLALRIYDAYYDIPEVAGLQRQINDLRLEYKEKYKKALQKTRTEYDGKLAEQVARMQRMGMTDTRNRKISQVLQSANALAKKLAANSSKKNVPDALKSPVMAILDSITAYADTERVTSLNKSFMDNLRKAHERFTDLYKDGTDADLTEIYEEHLDITEDFLEEMRRLRRQTDETLEVLDPKAGGHVLQHMDLAQLDALNRVLTQIHHMVMTAGELHRNEQYRNANELASDTIAELSEMKERVAHRFRIGDSVEEFLGWTNATPYYAFKRLGKGGMSIFAEMQKGFDDFAFRIRDVRDYAQSVYTAKEVRAWEKDVRVFKDAAGKEFRLTIPQIMSVYCLMNRDAALQHLLGGGITPGKVGKFQQSQRYKQTQQTLDAIIAELSPRQIEVADKLQAFLSTTCADWGNTVSIKRFGVRLFTENHYFPMAVDQNTVKSGDTPKLGNGLFDIINRSFTKELNDDASNALYAQDIFDVFTAHATDMAQYNALALPVLDMVKWYNGMTAAGEQTDEHEKSDRQNVKAEIERVYGKQAQEYIDQFMRDINGATSEDRMRIGKTLARNFKIAKVAANLNVALVQPTAFVRAANVIDPKYLFSALSGTRNLPTHIREMQQYSGIGLWKSLGFFDVDVNRSLSTMIKYGDTTADKIREAGMKGAEVADNMTWGLIFYACQKWAYKEKGLAFGSKACNEAAAEKFREIVYASQVVDSPMTRSALMRSKSGLDQAASAFMSEPTLSYNMLMDQVFEWQKGARSGLSVKENLKKNGKPITRAVATYCMTAVFAAAVEAISGALRDDDDDEFGEKYLDSFIDNLLSDLSIVQKIPGFKYLSEVAQAVLEGKSFSDSNPYTQTFKEFTSAASALRSGSIFEYKTIYKLLTYISGASGLPVSNLTREVVAMWNATVGAAIPECKLHRYDVSQKQKIMKFADGDDIRGQTQKLLQDKVDAKRKENPTANVHELEKDARSGLKSSITSAAKEIYQSGDTDKARRLMQQSGLYEAKDIQKNIDKWKAEAALG